MNAYKYLFGLYKCSIRNFTNQVKAILHWIKIMDYRFKFVRFFAQILFLLSAFNNLRIDIFFFKV